MGNRGKINFETWCKCNKKEELLNEWDYENNRILPSQISYGSHKEIFWICKNGHKYKKQIHSRCQGVGCSICSGANFQKRGSLFVEYPEYVKEIDLIKNSYEDVKNISSGSARKIWWKCSEGHSYEMSAASKLKSKGCPICNNKRVLSGYNDLETKFPELIRDWDFDKNVIKPSEVMFGSKQKVHWKCHLCNYSWDAIVVSRTIQGTGCPNCVKRLRTSIQEQAILYYISKNYNDVISGDRDVLQGLEIDVYIPSLKIGIEYDGKRWHKNKLKDEKKNAICKEKGIILYRIREKGCPILEYNSNVVVIECESEKFEHLNKAFIELFEYLKLPVDVNIERDMIKIKEQYYACLADNSLEKLYPEIAKEWHPEKNGEIKPDMVMAGTHDLFYWLCPQGHTYMASVKNRVQRNSSCPYCSNKKILKGYNDIRTTHPQIALDYDDEKNERKSYEVSAGCSDFAWWKCHKCGFEYYYQISTYIKGKLSCPACSNRGKTKFQKILKYETMEIFDNLPEAAKSLGLVNERDINRAYKNIFNSCSGNTVTAYGFHWFYILVNAKGEIIDDLNNIKIKNVDKSILGNSFTMNDGQRCVVIEDNGCYDISVQFEDGTIVKHRKRQEVRIGAIRNPNYSKYLGLKNTNIQGLSLEIIRYKNCNDLDVEFEDGYVIEHTSLNKFNKGIIVNPLKIENNTNTNISSRKLISKIRFSILGEKNKMKCGDIATVIEDNGCDDITVQFEDGTIVLHKDRWSFRKGNIYNPNIIQSYLNKEKIMECGLSCKIINVRAKDDIDVEFEDKSIVEHTTISKFEKGTILTYAMSHNYRYRTGERKKMKCGKYATIIEDRGSRDIDVQFDDGVIVRHRERANFERGSIAYPENKSLLGQTKVMNNGLKATVIKDNGWDDITIEFENGVIVEHRRRSRFKDGSISIR